MSDYVTKAEFEAFKNEMRVAMTSAPKASAGETSTQKPKFDFEIKVNVGGHRGKTPSQLSSEELAKLATWQEEQVANPPPGKEQYVENNKKSADSYRRWERYKRAIEQGLVKEEPVAKDPDWVTSDDGYSPNEAQHEADATQYDDGF